MKRTRIGASMLMAAVIALGLGACDDNRDEYGYDGMGRAPSAYCAQYTTCGTCTPVVGCGWCYNGNGPGTCASDPDQCTGSAFSWTWETTGCRVGADASTVDPGDAGKSDAAHEASTTDAAGDAPRETFDAAGEAASDAVAD